jgi:hypothetical protein
VTLYTSRRSILLPSQSLSGLNGPELSIRKEDNIASGKYKVSIVYKRQIFPHKHADKSSIAFAADRVTAIVPGASRASSKSITPPGLDSGPHRCSVYRSVSWELLVSTVCVTCDCRK